MQGVHYLINKDHLTTAQPNDLRPSVHTCMGEFSNHTGIEFSTVMFMAGNTYTIFKLVTLVCD